MYGRPQWLDRERCFYLWMELGSVVKVCSRLYSEGVRNPTTGKPPSEPGVRIAAWKWALYHPEEARQMFIKYTGCYTDDQMEYWLDRLQRISRAFLTTRVDRYLDWKDQFKNYLEEGVL